MRRRVLVLGLLLFAVGVLATVALVHRQHNEPKPVDVLTVSTVVTYCVDSTVGSHSYHFSSDQQKSLPGSCPP
jgi:uncharacterized membrane protein YoaK (UPF0700 family)